jgi:hypothetical protein
LGSITVNETAQQEPLPDGDVDACVQVLDSTWALALNDDVFATLVKDEADSL